MIVAIDQNICTGCRECAEVCPAYAIVGEQGKPQTIDTDRCVMCGQCMQLHNQTPCFCTYRWKRRIRK